MILVWIKQHSLYFVKKEVFVVASLLELAADLDQVLNLIVRPMINKSQDWSRDCEAILVWHASQDMSASLEPASYLEAVSVQDHSIGRLTAQ